MIIEFSKYQGTGNDFILLNNLDGRYNELSINQISFLCDRRFGVGADGLIKINRSEKAQYEVDYYNSDGSKSFCGNGARCAVAFASIIGLETTVSEFDAYDGLHHAVYNQLEVGLGMSDLSDISVIDGAYVLNTGSPHYIQFVEDLKSHDIVSFGKEIRYSDRFKQEGVNVNLVQEIENGLAVLTYERGVEDETLSCGTGVTAAVLAYAFKEKMSGKHTVSVNVKGGNLKVSFNQESLSDFTEVQLIGPAVFVFKGSIDA
jgi:diaminopimelate epimerase